VFPDLVFAGFTRVPSFLCTDLGCTAEHSLAHTQDGSKPAVV